MTYRLTESDLARMRAEHVPVKIDGWLWCAACTDAVRGTWRAFPCAAAELLAHFAPGPVPHLAELSVDHCHCGLAGIEMSHPRHPPTSEQQVAIAVGLLGPVCSEELPQ